MLANAVLFQLGWFAAVLGGANQLPWIGPLCIAAVIGWHLHTTANPADEIRLILFCGVAGAIFESSLVAAGWVEYASESRLAPSWIVAMWMLFGTTLNVSFRWLHGKHLLAALIGFVAGPASYLAGAKLGGVEFPSPVLALTALAIGWGIALPALLSLARQPVPVPVPDRQVDPEGGVQA